MKNIRFATVISICFVLLTVCFMQPVKTQASGMKITKKNVKVNEGDSFKLKVKKAVGKVKWSSSNADVVKVVKISGKKKEQASFKALRAGKAKITAKIGKKKLKSNITVNHIHSYSQATCTSLATCSCGAVIGGFMPHNPVPQSATCVQPAICSNCNTVVENAKGHNYYNGICTLCGDIDLYYFMDFTLVGADGERTNYVGVILDTYYDAISAADYIELSNANCAGGEYALLNGNIKAHFGDFDEEGYWVDLISTIIYSEKNKYTTLYFRFGADSISIPYGSNLSFYIKFKNQLYQITVKEEDANGNTYTYKKV